MEKIFQLLNLIYFLFALFQLVSAPGRSHLQNFPKGSGSTSTKELSSCELYCFVDCKAELPPGTPDYRSCVSANNGHCFCTLRNSWRTILLVGGIILTLVFIPGAACLLCCVKNKRSRKRLQRNQPALNVCPQNESTFNTYRRNTIGQNNHLQCTSPTYTEKGSHNMNQTQLQMYNNFSLANLPPPSYKESVTNVDSCRRF